MKTLAFHIQKGGTGKTTLTGNVGSACAEQKKTVLIGADPQGNLSSWLLESAFPYELADVLMDKVRIEDALVPLDDDLWLLGTFVDGELGKLADSGDLVTKPFIFVELMEKLKRYGTELVVLDLSPGMRLLERLALVACNEVIRPLTPEYFSLDGVETFSCNVDEINRHYRSNVQHRIIVENMINRSFRRHQVIHAELEKLAYELHVVPQDAKIGESQVYHQSIFRYDERARSVAPIRKLAQAIMRNGDGS